MLLSSVIFPLQVRVFCGVGARGIFSTIRARGIASRSIESELNEEQRLAVRSQERCVRVVAGPGSGKTLVLTHRIAHEISESRANPENILCITFTNKAAGEIRERICALLGKDAARKLTVSTFHSFCAKLLREILPAVKAEFRLSREFAIYDERDCEKILKDIFLKVVERHVLENDNNSKNRGLFNMLLNFKAPAVVDGGDNKRVKLRIPPEDLKRCLNLVQMAKSFAIEKFIAGKRRRDPPELPRSITRDVTELLRLFEESLRANNAADFDDLINLTIRELHQTPAVLQMCENRWTSVLVDEFQDTDKAQYELVRLLCCKNQSLFVVGDVDQAIYGWRGAESRNMQYSLGNDFPCSTTFQLKKNYRSSRSILRVASRIIGNSGESRRVGTLEGLSLVPVKTSKEPVKICWLESPDEECQFVVNEILRTKRNKWSDCAVLYRTHRQSFLLESAFIRAGIPYRLLGAIPLFSHKVIKELLSYLYFILNTSDELSLTRIINTPPRGIGEVTILQLKEWASSLDLPLSKALLTKDLDDSGLSSRAKKAVLSFCQVLKSLIEASEKSSVSELLELIVLQTGFRDYIAKSVEEDVYEKRIQYLEQLLGTAALADSKYGTGRGAVALFLQDVMLVSEATTTTEESNCASLSSLHAAKGMEFNTVFIIGVNHGTIPHELSDPEEERRLLYVGITRAKEHLYLTHTHGYGGIAEVYSGEHKISRFLREILSSKEVRLVPEVWPGIMEQFS